MKIGILLTGHAPNVLIGQTGDYSDFFQRLLKGKGFEFETYSVVDMEFPENVESCDGWLITGSRHGTYDNLPFIEPLEKVIREAYSKSIPLVGICFGHQIIAQALGGKVEKYENGWIVGPQTYQFNGDRITVNAWHQDQVIKLPENARVVGRSESCEYAALAYDNRAYTVQAHPEFDSPFVTDLIATRGRGMIADTILNDAEAKLSQSSIDHEYLAKKITDFFLQPRG